MFCSPVGWFKIFYVHPDGPPPPRMSSREPKKKTFADGTTAGGSQKPSRKSSRLTVLGKCVSKPSTTDPNSPSPPRKSKKKERVVGTVTTETISEETKALDVSTDQSEYEAVPGTSSGACGITLRKSTRSQRTAREQQENADRMHAQQIAARQKTEAYKGKHFHYTCSCGDLGVIAS